MGMDFYQIPTGATLNVPVGAMYLGPGAGLSGAGTVASPFIVNQTVINKIINSVAGSAWFDPRYVYSDGGTGWAFNTVQNITLGSEMMGYLRGNPPVSYVQFTETSGDCVSLQTANNIRFNGLALLGTTSGNLIHWGGGVHDSGGRDCWFRNTSTSAGSGPTTAAACWSNDSGLVNNSSEDNDWTNTYFDGGYNGIIIGANYSGSQQRANDSVMYNCRTFGGQYGVYHNAGGQWSWVNWYDRSSPAVAAYYVSANASGAVSFFGGEVQVTGSSNGYNFSVNGGYVSLYDYLNTIVSSAPGVQVTGGTLNLVTGRAASAGTPLIVTGGIVNIGAQYDASNFTLTSGTGGTVYMTGPAGILSPFNGPTIGNYQTNGGNVVNIAYPAVVATSSQTAATSPSTLSYTPLATVGTYRATVGLRATTVTTSIGVVLAYKNAGGGTTSDTLVFAKQGSATLVTSVTATGSYMSVPIEFSTDNSATAMTITPTFTSATADIQMTIERIA